MPRGPISQPVVTPSPRAGPEHKAYQTEERPRARREATMSHWHKLGFQAFLAKEIMRKDTLPFAIGMGFVALMGLGLNASITEEDRKSSAYHKQFVLNDRKGDH